MLAVLYDIHGNTAALDAVLADARADSYLLGGDYGLFGPDPAGVLERLRGLPGAQWIRGNVDRWGAQPEDAPDDELLRAAISDYRAALGPDRADELGELPEELVLDGTRYCHASPASDLESFLPEPGTNDDHLLAGASERRIVFGHTHLQFRRARPDGIELINPGSVGMPLDGDQRAAYALVDDDGEFELRRVDYDPGPTIGALSDAPWALRTANRLRTARL